MVARYDRDVARQILDGLAETELAKLASDGGRRLRVPRHLAPERRGLRRSASRAVGSSPGYRTSLESRGHL